MIICIFFIKFNLLQKIKQKLRPIAELDEAYQLAMGMNLSLPCKHITFPKHFKVVILRFLSNIIDNMFVK